MKQTLDDLHGCTENDIRVGSYLFELSELDDDGWGVVGRILPGTVLQVAIDLTEPKFNVEFPTTCAVPEDSREYHELSALIRRFAADGVVVSAAHRFGAESPWLPILWMAWRAHYKGELPHGLKFGAGAES